jgi:protein-disulfide isomerase
MKLRIFLLSVLFFCGNAYADTAEPLGDYFPEVSKVMEDDLLEGNQAAAVIVVEYSSLSCPHCAEFHKYSYPTIKQKYIDTNKILYIARDFPNNSPSVLGSMLARCQGDKRLKTVEVLFSSQQLWAFRPDFQNQLRDILILGGMNETQFNDCINDNQTRDRLLKESYEAAKTYGIRGTPSIFVNGHRVGNVMSIKVIEKMIDSQLAESDPTDKARAG